MCFARVLKVSQTCNTTMEIQTAFRLLTSEQMGKEHRSLHGTMWITADFQRFYTIMNF